jgi:MoaA/NifB/PqqE/SkfB family radical SAM enzyme
MQLTGLHILLTYRCTSECDHCFVWGSPAQSGVFTLRRLEELLRQAVAAATIHEIYFEGGEAFLFHPLLVAGVARAHALGFTTGIVSNAYWASTPEDAQLWLEPLARAGLDQLSVSCDVFHSGDTEMVEPENAGRAARALGIASGEIALEPPTGYRDPAAYGAGLPVTGGDVMYRGRAAVKLVDGLPRRPWSSFDSCPYEELASPSRVHVDPFGNLHLCTGLVMGNVFERPLAEIFDSYDPAATPVVREIVTGGPAELVRRYSLAHEAGYVDACHLCDSARRALRGQFPAVLRPDQMYGVS